MWVNEIYLAGPFSHEDQVVMEQRYHEHCRAAAHLMADCGHNKVFSPISHSYGIWLAGAGNAGFEAWREMDTAQLDASHSFAVLEIPGWQESRGIRAELFRFLQRIREDG